MIKISSDLPRHYRYRFVMNLRFKEWQYSYEIIGAKGGAHLHVSGPHHYDNEDHWSAGLELHSRTPIGDSNSPPSHDHCWLLNCPCWSDGTSLYASEYFLPLFFAENHKQIFLDMAEWADRLLRATKDVGD